MIVSEETYTHAAVTFTVDGASEQTEAYTESKSGFAANDDAHPAKRTPMSVTRDEVDAKIDAMSARLSGDLKNIQTELAGNLKNTQTQLAGDLQLIRQELTSGLRSIDDAVGRQFAELHANMHEQSSTNVKWIVGTLVAATSVAVAFLNFSLKNDGKAAAAPAAPVVIQVPVPAPAQASVQSPPPPSPQPRQTK